MRFATVRRHVAIVDRSSTLGRALAYAVGVIVVSGGLLLLAWLWPTFGGYRITLVLFAVAGVAASLAIGVWRSVRARAERAPAPRSTAEALAEEAAVRSRRDVVEREQEAQRHAADAGRLKDELLATMSHELRTPMHAILGWARLLQSGALDEPGTARALDTIVRNTRAEAALIDDLLDMSHIVGRQIELQIEPVDTTLLVQSVLDATGPMADAKHITLVARLASRPCIVAGDRRRLQQIVRSLLSNAVKFTPEGGTIEIGVERTDADVRIRITDTGIGIRPAFLPHVFDGLRQADASSTRRHMGLGVGLAIARHLVEAHGGTISAASDGEGRGSTFTVQFGAAAGRPVPPSVLGQAVAMEELAVLVVDDEADAREMVAAILRQCGMDVTIAASAAEALRALERRSFDLIVSDVGMPDEDGCALIRRLRERPAEAGGQIPALALTGFGHEADRTRLLDAGFQRHLVKPAEPSALISAVASLVQRPTRAKS